MLLSRFSTDLSVRSRLIVLSLIPVVGFAAIALAYLSSEQAVDAAFDSVQQSSRLSEASRAFKEALTTMHMRAKDFVAQPQPGLVARFGEAHESAMANLKTVGELVSDAERQNVTLLEGRVANLKTTFAALAADQDELGFTEFEGTQGRLRDNGNAMERMVSDDMSWLSDADQKKILIPLMLMRRHEIEYRLTREDSARSLFKDDQSAFEKGFTGIVAASVMKQTLIDQVKAYADAFTDWMASSVKIARSIAVISAETRQMLPAADEIIASANRKTEAAAQGVAESQQRTKLWIVGIGIAVVGLGLLFNWLIGRSIAGPLRRLSGAMSKLAAGDSSIDIPSTDAKDEIGAMARTVIVFRDNAIEREQLAVTQEKSVRERERRAETIAATVAQFEQTVDQALAKVRGAAERLETASSALNSAADSVSAQASSAEERVGAASMNVASAASSAEELATSIGEIAQQAATSTDVASRAVTEAQRTVETMSQLANRRNPYRRGDRADPGDCRPDQPARTQCHHRGGARGRRRARLCGRRLGSEEPRRADRQGDRGGRDPNRRDPVGRGRCHRGDRAGQQDHRRNVRDRGTRRLGGRGAERRGVDHRGGREPRFGGSPLGR
ncbi:MAG: HAMP domain-containing protein [Alphaproteobacteria bacterium]